MASTASPTCLLVGTIITTQSAPAAASAGVAAAFAPVSVAKDAARPGTTTVAVEALNWGFWHFGEFSRAYKNCFGELPSQTLRRKP